jgi:RHS repeat-associated protein
VTTDYAWDENNDLPMLASEWQGSTVLRDYLYGDRLISMNSGGAAYYFHHDALDTTTALTKSTAAVEWTYTYDPNGNARTTTKVDPSAPTNPIQYTGELLDSETGIYDLRARLYGPSLGRFMTVDPLEYEIANPENASYIYVKNASLLLTDPSGQRPEDVDSGPGGFPCLGGGWWFASPSECSLQRSDSAEGGVAPHPSCQDDSSCQAEGVEHRVNSDTSVSHLSTRGDGSPNTEETADPTEAVDASSWCANTEASEEQCRSAAQVLSNAECGPNASTDQRQTCLYQFFTALGLSPVQTAAMIGNLYGEGDFLDPASSQGCRAKDPTCGYGIVQWGGGAVGRLQGLLQYACPGQTSPTVDSCKTASSFRTQAAYIWKEINGREFREILDALRQQHDVKNATYALCVGYFKPAACLAQRADPARFRAEWAKRTLRGCVALLDEAPRYTRSCSSDIGPD